MSNRTRALDDSGFSTVKLHSGATVLLVDDEDLMRDVVAVMLEEHGATVFPASSADEGLEIYNRERERITGVFIDFSMPNKNGLQLYEDLRKVSPEPPVLFVSGLPFVPEVLALWKEGHVETLTKPFHEVELIKALNKIYERHASLSSADGRAP